MENSDQNVPRQQVQKSEEKSKKKKSSHKNLWALKITIVTFILSGLFSFLSDVATDNSNLIIAIFIIVLLIVIGIITDAIAIAVTTCDPAPLTAMASKKVPGSKNALILINNSEKVASICADVIGDICGIISGTCCAVVVAKLITLGDFNNLVLSLLISSIVASLTVGGKAFMKKIAMKHAKEFVLYTAKLMSVFVKEK